MTLFSFRDKDLADFYDSNFGEERRSLSAKNDLNRYRWLLSKEMPKFSPEEAVAIWSAFNGANTSHAEMLPMMKVAIAHELEEGVRVKLLALTEIQWLAVVDACDRVGKGSYHISKLLDELAGVGLIQRITTNPDIFGGKPIIRGHRLAVEHVLQMLGAGDTSDTLLEAYPWLEPEDIQACLSWRLGASS